MQPWVWISFSLLLIPGTAASYSICSCGPRPNVEEAYRRAFAVFEGRVLEVDRRFSPDRHEVRFLVSRSWKGVSANEVTVYSGGTDDVAKVREGITCGYNFTPGQEYLVYSYRDDKRHGPAFVSDCSRTQPLSGAGLDVQTLGEPEATFTAPQLPAHYDPPREELQRKY